MRWAIIICAGFLASSCAMILDPISDADLQKILCGRKLYNCEDFSFLKTEEDILNYIDEQVSYEDSLCEYAQNPELTLSLHTGDCKAFSVLFLDIVYFSLGKKYSLAVVNTKERKVVNGGEVNHVVVMKNDGTLIDPQNGDDYDYTVCYSFTFNEVFNGGK